MAKHDKETWPRGLWRGLEIGKPMKCLYCQIEWIDIDKFIEHTKICMAHHLESHNYGAFRSITSRGLPYYGEYKQAYPYHWASFCDMHKRKSEIDALFSRSFEGFVHFVFYLGPVPEDMIRPSIGRKDHLVGYKKGNFCWQEFSDNAKEGRLRNADKHRNIGKTLSPNREKHLSLLDFLSKNQGRFHIKDIYSKLGYKSGRCIWDHISKMANCKIENYKSTENFYIVL